MIYRRFDEVLFPQVDRRTSSGDPSDSTDTILCGAEKVPSESETIKLNVGLSYS